MFWANTEVVSKLTDSNNNLLFITHNFRISGVNCKWKDTGVSGKVLKGMAVIS